MKKLTIVLVMLVLAGGLAVMRVFDPFEDQVQRFPSGLGDYPHQGAYRFNPQTIITSLGRGETNVFTPVSAVPGAYTSMLEQPITPPWHEADYLKVAEALSTLVWKESLISWRVESLVLDTSCRADSVGFGIGRLIYFKPTWVNGQLVYAAREIDIHPLDNEVSWGGDANFPHPIFGWKSVDPKKIEISAEDALAIAEADGARAARQSVQNRCQISLRLSGDNGWYIWYDGDDGLPIYKAYIDPNTGKVIRRPAAP